MLSRRPDCRTLPDSGTAPVTAWRQLRGLKRPDRFPLRALRSVLCSPSEVVVSTVRSDTFSPLYSPREDAVSPMISDEQRRSRESHHSRGSQDRSENRARVV